MSAPAPPRAFLPCAHLRTKSMFTPRFEKPVDPKEPSSTASWWCALTTRPTGPDGGLVDPPVCMPGRSCYREP